MSLCVANDTFVSPVPVHSDFYTKANNTSFVTAVAFKSLPDSKIGLSLIHTDELIKVLGIDPDGIFAGSSLEPGMTLLSINNVQTTGLALKDVANIIQTLNQGTVVIFASTASSDEHPQENVLHTEDQFSQAKDIIVPPQAVAESPTLPSMTMVLGMTKPELGEELVRHGLSKEGSKEALMDRLLEKFCLPETAQFKQWRTMNVTLLKDELRKRNLRVGGTKYELLARLHVSEEQGVTYSSDTDLREKKEVKEKRTIQATTKSLNSKKKKQKLNPEDDPTHEDYAKDCCHSPRFPSWPQRDSPAGFIEHADGSVTEVWTCLTCGEIPEHPNAPPIQKFNDKCMDEVSQDELDFHYISQQCSSSDDCIIQ